MAERGSGEREAEDAFSPEMYRAIFEAAPDGVLLVDPAGSILAANPAAEHMFGYGKGELEGRAVELLVPESARARHSTQRAHYVREGRPRPMGVGLELRGRRRSGRDFPVEISLSPVRRGEGEAPLVIASIRDVTQRKRLQEFSTGALRATEEERRRIARELHDDTAQRLSGLLVRLRLLERSVQSEGEPLLQELRRELVGALESVRRVASGLRPPELQDAGVALALRAHVRRLQETTGLKVELEVDAVDHLLGPDAQLVLYRIVQEALSNVLRHSGAATARVCVRREEGQVGVLVEDAGSGFDPEQIDGREGRLGLAGMEERAMMVGGRIRIESAPGSGTRVRVRIPVDFSDEVKT